MTDSTLKTALLSLSVENDNHWTKAGLPRIETLQFITGDFSLTKEKVEAEIPGFNRAAATMPTTVVKETTKPELSLVENEPELSLKDQLIIEQNKLDELGILLFKAKEAYDTHSAYVSKIVTLLYTEHNSVDNQNAIGAYLRGQQLVLEERAARQKLISESGINLKELADNLRSPLDTSLARRQRSR